MKLKAVNFPCFLRVKIYTNGKNRSLAAAKAENRPQAPTVPDKSTGPSQILDQSKAAEQQEQKNHRQNAQIFLNKHPDRLTILFQQPGDKEKRMPRESTEAMPNTHRLRSTAPLAMVTTL